MIKLDYCGLLIIGEPTSDGDFIAATSSREEAKRAAGVVRPYGMGRG